MSNTSVELEQFFESFEEHKQSHEKFVLIFKGSIDPVTQENWCSDCVQAEPYIQKVLVPLAQQNNVPILTCYVGLKDKYKDPENPLRTDKVIKLAGVPHIMLYEKIGITKKLKEEQCWDEELLQELLE